MNKELIKSRLKRCSDAMDKSNREAEVNALKEQNQHLQDFVLWLIGHLDAIEPVKS